MVLFVPFMKDILKNIFSHLLILLLKAQTYYANNDLHGGVGEEVVSRNHLK